MVDISAVYLVEMVIKDLANTPYCAELHLVALFRKKLTMCVFDGMGLSSECQCAETRLQPKDRTDHKSRIPSVFAEQRFHFSNSLLWLRPVCNLFFTDILVCSVCILKEALPVGVVLPPGLIFVTSQMA